MKRWMDGWGLYLLIDGWPLVVGPLLAEYAMLAAQKGWAWYWHVLVDLGAAIVLFVVWDFAAYMADDDGDMEMSLIFDWSKRRRRKNQQAPRGHSAD